MNNSLVRDCLELARSINKLLPDLACKPVNGDNVAYTVAKAHCASCTAPSLSHRKEGRQPKEVVAIHAVNCRLEPREAEYGGMLECTAT